MEEMQDERSQSEAELKASKLCRVCKRNIANVHSDICRSCFSNAKAALTSSLDGLLEKIPEDKSLAIWRVEGGWKVRYGNNRIQHHVTRSTPASAIAAALEKGESDG